MSAPRIARIVDDFLRSRFYDNSRFGVSNDDWLDDPERMQRITDAAENGADGSTHREVIEDMRRIFRDYLRVGVTHNPKRRSFAEHPSRVEDAVMAHFDDLETWHEQNGSADQEIG